MREHFLHALAELEGQIRDMGNRVSLAVRDALWSLERNEPIFARQIIANDNVIDELRYQIETNALSVITRQQPMARDLRVVSMFLELASELERIGDYAEGIAELVIRCIELPALDQPAQIKTMALKAQAMLRDALDALHERDPQAAERLEHSDDEIDGLYREVLAWTFATMRSQPDYVERAMYYLWIAHNLERIADRTINIGERTSFIATGIIDKHRLRKDEASSVKEE